MTVAVTEEIASIDLPDGMLPYVLRRTARARGLRMTIDDRRGLIVSVPPPSRRGWARPEALIEGFIRERERWIRRHLEKRRAAQAVLAARGGLIDGGLLRYRGELHRLRIESIGRGRSSVARIGGDGEDTIAVRLVARDADRIGTVLASWARGTAGREVDRAIVRHTGALGVAPSRISIRDPRSRWGSAARGGGLMFSWRLVLAPPEALDTVVVHELCHLREFGHGPTFWALVASRRPDHLEWRRWLRRHSFELHHALDEPDGAA